MTKEQFTKVINELVQLKKIEEELNIALKKLEPGINYIGFGRYEDLIVRALEIAMQDDNQWISYWLYDLDCGRDKEKKVLKNGKRVKMKTAEDLYHCIKNDK